MNDDSYIITLRFPEKEWVSGMCPGGEFIFHTEVDGKPVAQNFTSITLPDVKGHATFAVKTFKDDPFS